MQESSPYTTVGYRRNLVSDAETEPVPFVLTDAGERALRPALTPSSCSCGSLIDAIRRQPLVARVEVYTPEEIAGFLPALWRQCGVSCPHCGWGIVVVPGTPRGGAATMSRRGPVW